MRTSRVPNRPLPGLGLAWGHPLARDIVGRFLFNEGAGRRVRNIAGGMHNDALLQAMDPATDWIGTDRGQALAFDGVDDGAEAIIPLAATGSAGAGGVKAATVLVWFRTDTTQSVKSIISIPDSNPAFPGVDLYFLNATTVSVASSGENNIGVFIDYVTTYNDNRWHQLVLTHHAEAGIRMYYDGRLVGSSSTALGRLLAGYAIGGLDRLVKLHFAMYDSTTFGKVDLMDARVYRRALNADEVLALYNDPYADTHRPLYWFPDRAHTKRELEGYIGGDWRNLTQDMLLNPDLSIEYGISGTSPTERAAGAGSMSWAMNNSEWNSALTRGLYSPDHANHRPGFTPGMSVRFTYRGISGAVYRKHVGWLASIDPDPFIEEDRRVRCRSNDWMAEAGIFTPSGIAIQVEQTADQVATALLNGTARRPVGTRFDVGKVVFPYAPDNSRSGEQPILGEFQSLAMSEWGYFYLLGDGTLRFENQSARLVPTIKASFSNTIASLRVGQSRGRIKNVVKVTVHPRRADDNDNVVLYQLPDGVKAPFVPAGQELNLNGPYKDPANRQTRVAGINMQAPTPLTDYDMHHNANGGGASMAANFDVTAAFGANDVKLKIKSNAAQGGYVTKLQVRGRGLYDDAPYDVEARDEASIALYGVSELKIDMPYNADSIVAQAVANYVLGQFSDPITADASLSVIAGDPVTEELVMSIEPGDAITAQETLTGINFVFFVQHVSYRMPEDGITMAEFLLQRGPLADYWALGVAGRGELGQTTVVAPL